MIGINHLRTISINDVVTCKFCMNYSFGVIEKNYTPTIVPTALVPSSEVTA